MPFSVVLTNERSSNLISLVPSTWVTADSYLFWPRSKKKCDLEALRRDENSLPSDNWMKMKCKVKLSGIDTYEEGLRMEEFYLNFVDTDDEERYSRSRKEKRKHPTTQIYEKELMDLNSDFHEATTDNAEIKTKNNEVNENDNMTDFNIQMNTENIVTENYNITDCNQIISDQNVSISVTDYNQIISEHTALINENKTLKETVKNIENFREETKTSFLGLQVQLDKIFDLLSKKPGSVNIDEFNETFESSRADGEICLRNINFPVNSKEQLDLLENELADKEYEKEVIRKFSKVCGTSGKFQLSKIGLELVKSLFTDEFLAQCTWKGIKGCDKIAFLTYFKTRNLTYKILHLADSSCSEKDTDAFLQHSAIKHSGQRIKRKLCGKDTITNQKKKKIEDSVPTKATHKENTIQLCVTKQTDCEETENAQKKDEKDEKQTEREQEIKKVTTEDETKPYSEDDKNKNEFESLHKENNTFDPVFMKNRVIRNSQKVTVLEDIRICNKISDMKHETKKMNISSDDLRQTTAFIE